MMTIEIKQLPNGYWQCEVKFADGQTEKADLFHDPSMAMDWAREKVVWKYWDIIKH